MTQTVLSLGTIVAIASALAPTILAQDRQDRKVVVVEFMKIAPGKGANIAIWSENGKRSTRTV
jgi:hypothetical protein